MESAGAAAIALDSLLLNLDRNNFASLFPFYWSAVSTWFSMRYRKFLRAAVITDASLLIVIYSIVRTSKIELYRWPIVMIVLFAAVVFLQALSLLYSMPPQTKIRFKEKCLAIAAVLLIIVTGGFLFIKPVQEQAIEMGGGLLEPKFFSFDFTKFLKLDPEISVKNDLILIVKKEFDMNRLLRRSVLSGYSRRQGFYRIDELDEKTHSNRLPSGKTFFSPPEFQASRLSPQEYFLVNIESTAFIGMKEPVSVTPYENWNSSSFNSAYAVESLVSRATTRELYNSTPSWPLAADLGLSDYEFKTYTEYGKDERLRALAEEITRDKVLYVDKVNAVYQYLKFGDYRYSLKPGIAPDGDQLSWFLFNSKKGYCSYYAFSMTLLLRSLGIPARLAAGFFIDPKTNTFDYYPVRSDMAHAWVEVAYPKYGWIEYDPTTETVAEDEEFQFAPGTDPALFEKLMKEIFENRSKLKAKDGAQEAAETSGIKTRTQNTIKLLRNYWYIPLAAFFIILIVSVRWGFFIAVFLTGSPRRKSIYLMKHACRRLYLAGVKNNGSLAEPEWAQQMESRFPGIYPMYQAAAAARFAPEYTKKDFEEQKANYKKLRASIRGGSSLKVPVLLLALFIASSASNAQETADDYFMEAIEADYNEYWDRAIHLYKEGSKRFPEDDRFLWSLGNLYYGRALFGLAWEEYKKIEALTPDDIDILVRLAKTAGLLNRDLESVYYYERVIALDPYNKDAIGSLGWMYSKIHRLNDGERLLVSALEHFGDDPDYAQTLGTIYSYMYRYDEGKYWYNKAIAMGEEIGDRVFTATVWYNLSLLETRFYNYELCMEATNSSINVYNRASGRMAMGDIYRRQLKLESAQKEFEAAYEIDTSPLAKLKLAQAYQMSGRLDEARLYAEDCLKGTDNSWMVNFGIDLDRYKRDIHLILLNIYSGLAEVEKLTPWPKLSEKIQSVFRTISYKTKYEINTRLYRKYSLAAANAYRNFSGEDSLQLDAYIQYYNAFADYPRRALSYRNMARSFETAIIPQAAVFYDFTEGVLLGREKLVEKALDEFDPLWERESISKCYGEFAKPQKKNIFSRRKQNPNTAAEELFAMNRGALRQNGIVLPVKLNMVLGKEAAVSKRQLQRAIFSGGFKKAGTGARYTLTVKIEGSKTFDYTASFELTDNLRETETISSYIPLRTTKRTDIYSFARTLGSLVFTVE
jgi:tetratricopeptide (TPR) repeat protein